MHLRNKKISLSLLETAGHDRSDGGLITTLLEMAFAGNTGLSITLDLSLSSSSSPLEFYGEVMSSLFSEELGNGFLLLV